MRSHRFDQECPIACDKVLFIIEALTKYAKKRIIKDDILFSNIDVIGIQETKLSITLK